MKKISGWLIAIGISLLLGALGITAYNLWDESRADRSARDSLEHLRKELPSAPEEPELVIPDYVLNPEMAMPTQEVDGLTYLGVLEVPVLELELPILSSWDTDKLRIAPCWYSGSVYLNDMVIAGHNYASHFSPLKQLRAGDQVRFTDMAGNCFLYEVGETEVLEAQAIEEMVTSGWDLSLFTCTFGGKSRFTVRCRLVEEQPAEGIAITGLAEGQNENTDQ